ncbi:carboxypeptidase regulatory-like domain-containing protein [Candidatus Aerophobetes bacterium]|uniref:Carboxypeptidase regulatory-like domain-containing protein n=1 Tax=Aerophobetes bacterium TaxID=2030807 RepID=A0A523W8G7_UNCAE|nr:MAG: carboxypeptidase regulatory-like domain-containing protein [Candidatus Aerophobetes bacterium]
MLLLNRFYSKMISNKILISTMMYPKKTLSNAGRGKKTIKYLLLWCLLLILLSTAVSAVEDHDSPGGTIKGTIINETRSGSSVENQEVTLHVERGNSEMESVTAKSDSSGNFEFSNLPTETDYGYYLSLNYQGGDYTSDIISFEENQNLLTVDLVVYDATASDEKIKITINHVMIERAEKGTLLISETLVFHNDDDKTYIGEKRDPSGEHETLRVPLPRGFYDLEHVEGLMECCVSQTKDGVVDTMDLKPGLKKVVLQYKLSYTAKSYLFEKSFLYPTSAFYVLAPALFQLSGENLTSQGPLQIEETEYMALGREEISAASTITFEIGGLPFGWGTHTRLVVVGLILAFVVIAGLSYSLSKRGKGKTSSEKAEKVETFLETDEYLKAKKKTLLSLIAHLDDQFEANEISENIYKEMRQEFKGRLIKAVQKLTK